MTTKVDRKLKVAAQKTAEDMGFQLGTLVNAFLRQFVRTKEVSFSMNHRPTRRLLRSIEIAEKELASGKLKKFSDIEDLLANLNSR
jgi:addiction module RelB/DinJ family antitoxin